jgi:hypothetical protein
LADWAMSRRVRCRSGGGGLAGGLCDTERPSGRRQVSR